MLLILEARCQVGSIYVGEIMRLAPGKEAIVLHMNCRDWSGWVDYWGNDKVNEIHKYKVDYMVGLACVATGLSIM